MLFRSNLRSLATSTSLARSLPAALFRGRPDMSSSAAGEESGGAAAPAPQGPVPVERVRAANGLEKVILREVRGNSVEVRYCSLAPLSLSLPPSGSIWWVFPRSDLGTDPWRWMPRSRASATAAPIPIIL